MQQLKRISAPERVLTLLMMLLGMSLLIACGQSSTVGPEEPTAAAESQEEGSNLEAAPSNDTYGGAFGRSRADESSPGHTSVPTQANSSQPDQGGADSPSTTELGVSQFIQAATQHGLLEVQAARLAQEQARSPEVKEFAATMSKAHERVNASLAELAKTKGLEVATEPSTEGQQLLEKLRGLTGTEFDRTYSEEMRRAHQQAVQLFEQAARSADDIDVKSFAQTQLPTLREHLRMAQTLPADNTG